MPVLRPRQLLSVLIALIVIGSPSLSHSELPQGQKESTPRIQEILVEGNRKIEKEAILNRMSLKVGSAFDAEALRKDIQSLFGTGYFFDISIFKEETPQSVRLKVQVLEKPTMAEIKYEGISEIKQEDLEEATDLKTYEIYNLGKVKEATEKILKLYEDKGFFLAKVEARVEDIKAGESVRLVFKIDENEKVKVKKITLLGVEKLPESDLKSKLITQEEGYFSGMSGSGAYKQDAFDRDLQVLKYLYWNQGYVQAKVDRPLVTVTPDKRGIYISIRIEEGEQYSVGDVDFAGDILYPREELFAAIQIHQNGVFAYDVLQNDLSLLQAKYGDLGYAYANVIPRTRFNEDERKVDLVFEFDKGNKVYFGQFNVVGNTKTRDKVVRRELKIFEGELYNETRRRQSMENIKRLGFFDDVNFKTSTPPGKPDIMNIDISVKERNTGQIQLGAGYGSSAGFTLQGSVQQSNFLGKGQNLGASLQLDSRTSTYDFSFSEPYFNDSLWSAGFRVFESISRDRADFDQRRLGASLFTGRPLTDYTRLNLSYSYTATRLFSRTLNAGTADETKTDQDLFPLSTAEGDSSTVGTSVEYDTRDDRFKPSKGIYTRLSYSNTGLFGGNLYYHRTGADFKYFKKLFWDVVWRNSVSYSILGSTRENREVPFNERSVMGGPYSLRGYRSGTVGQTRVSQALRLKFPNNPDKYTRVFGGTQEMIYQSEILFPLVKEAEMYGVLFYDVGQAQDKITDDEFYSNAGFGIRWFSPIGPLRFELGFPFRRTSENHDASVFEFSIGTPF